jgi:hypothetical protein
MKKFSLILLLALVLLPPFVAQAETTNLNLRILPQNCQYNVIDAGTQQLVFLTPEECGVLPPPNPGPGPETPPVTVGPPQGGSSQVPIIATTVTVDEPSTNATISGNSTILKGTAEPGTRITVYENNTVIGSTLTQENGVWELPYTATSSPVVLTFEACYRSSCAFLPDSLTLNFVLGDVCEVSLELANYSYRRVGVGSAVKLEPSSNIDSGLLSVDWGDEDKWMLPNFQLDSISKIYKEPGLYQGEISYSNDNCKSTRAFTVEVTTASKQSEFPWWIIISALLLALIILSYLNWKERKKRLDR